MLTLVQWIDPEIISFLNNQPEEQKENDPSEKEYIFLMNTYLLVQCAFNEVKIYYYGI